MKCRTPVIRPKLDGVRGRSTPAIAHAAWRLFACGLAAFRSTVLRERSGELMAATTLIPLERLPAGAEYPAVGGVDRQRNAPPNARPHRLTRTPDPLQPNLESD